MKILILSFYFEPDLCAGSFRITSFVKALKNRLTSNDTIEVVTTFPNRYCTYAAETRDYEQIDNITVRRMDIPSHKNALFDQAWSFFVYFIKTMWHVRNTQYDIVFASSSRLFTAFLGALISKQKKIPLYLDIRDIFVETMQSVLKNSMLRFVVPMLKLIEWVTMNRAVKINLVSEGFMPYFLKKYKKEYSIFSNGIDDEFLNFDFKVSKSALAADKKIVFTYTGNIGEGQGLEKIIPDIAQRFKNVEFWIIGDGGRKAILKAAVAHMQNVKLFAPVKRAELLEIYNKSDVLFLHLNNYEPFKRVLPSKLFEYIASYKPIIAGVDGYTKEFIMKYVPDSLVFEPCNISDFCSKYVDFKGIVDLSRRREFISIFSRQRIMTEMAIDLLHCAGK